MDKTSEVEAGKTPCVTCGRKSKILHGGEAYCSSCYDRKTFRVTPMTTKLASDHEVRSSE